MHYLYANFIFLVVTLLLGMNFFLWFFQEYVLLQSYPNIKVFSEAAFFIILSYSTDFL